MQKKLFFFSILCLITGCSSTGEIASRLTDTEKYVKTEMNSAFERKSDQPVSITLPHEISKSGFISQPLNRILAGALSSSVDIPSISADLKSLEKDLTEMRQISRPRAQLSTSTGTYTKDGYDYMSSLSFDASWIPDIYDRSSSIDAIEFESRKLSVIKMDGARLALSIKISKLFYEHLYTLKQIDILQRDLDLRQSQQSLTQRLVKAGFESESAIMKNEASIEEAQASIILEKNKALKQIEILSAHSRISPKELDEQISSLKDQSFNENLFSAPPPVNASYLLRRPDVATAYARLVNHLHETRLRHISTLPTVTVTGNVTGNPYKWGMRSLKDLSFSIGPISISIPLTNAPIDKAQKDLDEAQLTVFKKDFSSKVRTAAMEMMNARGDIEARGRAAAGLARSSQQYRKVNSALSSKYKAGLVSLFELEGSRRDLTSIESRIVDNELARILARLDYIYVTMGAGDD